MKVLVTGGTGVVGASAVTALLRHGHTVRLFSRNAAKDVEQWSEGVEPFPGSVSNPKEVQGAAADCDAVLHIAGVVAESPPEVTLENTNVEGTRAVVREAERAGVGKLIFVSSLGAERGESEYHKSKRKAEQIVRTFNGGWMIVRPGNVYGPGDEMISLLLKMVRSLPVVPVIDDGDRQFQPVWTDDLGEVLALAVERTDLLRRTLEVAGPERTSMNDLIDRFSKITGRSPARLPLPGPLATLGARVAGVAGVDIPITKDQLTMLDEGNVIDDAAHNALTAVFHVTPTLLDEGLERLADTLPEMLPSEGVGTLKRKRFWADVEGSAMSPEALFQHFRLHFGELTPWQVETRAEPGTPGVPDEGETLTLGLPLRGNIQVRVVEVTPRAMTLVTLEGHPLAGAVRFLSEPRGERLRFEVQVFDRPSNPIDWLLITVGGGALQNATWTQLVQNVAGASGGRAPDGVQSEIVSLDDEQREKVEEWLRGLVMERKREANEARGA